MRAACRYAPRHGIFCGTTQANVCAALGCVEEELEGARLYQSQFGEDPGAWGFFLASALIDNDQLEEAEAASRRALEIGGPAQATLLPDTLWRLGRRTEAVESLRQLFGAIGWSKAAGEVERLSSVSPEAVWTWIAEQQGAGNTEFAFANLNHWLSANAYAELGDMENALAALERSVAEHEPGLERWGLDPLFDPIRDTPRFKALIERMGLTAYQEKYRKQRPSSLGPAAQ